MASGMRENDFKIFEKMSWSVAVCFCVINSLIQNFKKWPIFQDWIHFHPWLDIISYWPSFVDYVLAQFLEDNIKSIVTENQVIKEDTGLVKAMYLDKQYYSCLVLGESGNFLYLKSQ